ncbi:MAG: hypothetical protein K8I60_06010 [Anaerolineae bacterium]|nr:hypothetical protein [Anaerolineae bacterium]
MDTQTIIIILVVLIVGALALVYMRRRRAKSSRDAWEYLREHRELFESELQQRRHSGRRGE